MYKCGSTCYSFNNGHICKHIHRVHSLILKQPLDKQAVPIENEYPTDDFGEAQYDSEDVKPMSVVCVNSAPDPHKGIQTHNTSTYLLYYNRSLHQTSNF